MHYATNIKVSVNGIIYMHILVEESRGRQNKRSFEKACTYRTSLSLVKYTEVVRLG